MPVRKLASVDLNLLVALDALIAERNVTRAGARIGLSQSAMSKALARLRSLFADPLLVRTPRGMALTAHAMALAEPLQRALSEVRRVVGQDSPFDPGSVRRTVTLGSLDLQELLILPTLLPRLRQSAPEIDLHVRATDRIDVVTALQASEVDLALMPMTANTSDLRSVVLYRDELVVLGHEAACKGLAMKRFLAFPHIMVSVEGHGTAPVDAALTARGLRRRVGLTVQHFMPVLFLVAASDMIAAVLARMARILADMVPVKTLPLPLPAEGYTMHMAWHRRHDAAPLLLWLRELLVDHAYRSVPPVSLEGRGRSDANGRQRPALAHAQPVGIEIADQILEKAVLVDFRAQVNEHRAQSDRGTIHEYDLAHRGAACSASSPRSRPAPVGLPVRLYEFDFDGEQDRAYTPALTLPVFVRP